MNTCAVTAEAVRQAKQSIRRIKRERPDARIVVTGCAAHTEPELFAAMPEVDRVVGNEEKLDPRTWVDDGARIAVGDIMAVQRHAAQAVAWLCSDAAADVTGQVLLVVGGKVSVVGPLAVLPIGRSGE